MLSEKPVFASGENSHFEKRAQCLRAIVHPALPGRLTRAGLAASPSTVLPSLRSALVRNAFWAGVAAVAPALGDGSPARCGRRWALPVDSLGLHGRARLSPRSGVRVCVPGHTLTGEVEGPGSWPRQGHGQGYRPGGSRHSHPTSTIARGQRPRQEGRLPLRGVAGWRWLRQTRDGQLALAGPELEPQGPGCPAAAVTRTKCSSPCVGTQAPPAGTSSGGQPWAPGALWRPHPGRAGPGWAGWARGGRGRCVCTDAGGHGVSLGPDSNRVPSPGRLDAEAAPGPDPGPAGPGSQQVTPRGWRPSAALGLARPPSQAGPQRPGRLGFGRVSLRGPVLPGPGPPWPPRVTHTPLFPQVVRFVLP